MLAVNFLLKNPKMYIEQQEILNRQNISRRKTKLEVSYCAAWFKIILCIYNKKHCDTGIKTEMHTNLSEYRPQR